MQREDAFWLLLLSQADGLSRGKPWLMQAYLETG